MGRDLRYPHQRHFYRTTSWKNTGIRLREGALLLARARGRESIRVPLSLNLLANPASAYKQVELVWDSAGRHYHRHVTLEDGGAPAPAPDSTVVAVDLCEIHPATMTDGQAAVVVTARRFRAARQYTAKRLSDIQAQQAGRQRGSRRWKRLQRRKSQFLAQQQKRNRDIEHTVSRAVVDYAVERKAGTLAIGDVRDIADGKRLGPRASRRSACGRMGRCARTSPTKPKLLASR
jgi:putative transposase